MNRAEAITRLREMALQVIGTSSVMLDAVESGAVEPTGVYDCEAWHLKRYFARKILYAIEHGKPVSPAWMVAIGRAAAGPGSRENGNQRRSP
jgi:hypothetical protein